MFDFSDCPKDSKFFDHVSKKVIGNLKEQFKVKIIGAFVGWKSKMYYLIDVDNEENKKAIGVCIDVLLIKKW